MIGLAWTARGQCAPSSIVVAGVVAVANAGEAAVGVAVVVVHAIVGCTGDAITVVGAGDAASLFLFVLRRRQPPSCSAVGPPPSSTSSAASGVAAATGLNPATMAVQPQPCDQN